MLVQNVLGSFRVNSHPGFTVRGSVWGRVLRGRGGHGSEEEDGQLSPC